MKYFAVDNYATPLSDAKIAEMVSTILANIKQVGCCLDQNGETAFDGSMFYQWRQQMVDMVDPKKNPYLPKDLSLGVGDIPGIDALIIGMVRSIEGSILAPYKPFLIAISTVLAALSNPIKAPKVIKKNIQYLIVSLKDLVDGMPNSVIDFAIQEVLGDFVDKAFMPLPNSEYLINIILGKKTFVDWLEEIRCIHERVKDASPEDKIEALKTICILPSTLIDLGKVLIPSTVDVSNIDKSIMLIDPSTLAGTKFANLAESFNVIPGPISLMDCIMMMLTMQPPNIKDIFKDIPEGGTDVDMEDIIAKFAQMSPFNYTAVLNIIITPIKTMMALVEQVIYLLNKILKNPLKLIKEIVKILKNPVNWIFGFIADALTAAMTGLFKDIMKMNGNESAVFGVALSLLLGNLLKLDKNIKMPDASKICTIISNAIKMTKEQFKNDANAMMGLMKFKGVISIIILLYMLIKVTIETILCLPTLLKWLFQVFKRKKKGDDGADFTDDEIQAEIKKASSIPFKIVGYYDIENKLHGISNILPVHVSNVVIEIEDDDKDADYDIDDVFELTKTDDCTGETVPAELDVKFIGYTSSDDKYESSIDKNEIIKNVKLHKIEKINKTTFKLYVYNTTLYNIQYSYTTQQSVTETMIEKNETYKTLSDINDIRKYNNYKELSITEFLCCDNADEKSFDYKNVGIVAKV